MSSPIEQLRYLVACRCGPEYTDRGLHEPNNIHEYSEDVEAVAAALAAVVKDFDRTDSNAGRRAVALGWAMAALASAPPPAEPAAVPWAAGPGQARCGVMYSGEHWAPRPCVKPNSHAFHADEYGRTWTAEPAPDRHCQHARDPATCKLCAGIAQRQRFDPDEVPAIRTAESVDLFNRAVALTVVLLDESQSDAERDDALVERCNIRDELKRRDELWRSDG